MLVKRLDELGWNSPTGKITYLNKIALLDVYQDKEGRIQCDKNSRNTNFIESRSLKYSIDQ